MAVIGGAASCGILTMRAILQAFKPHVTVCRKDAASPTAKMSSYFA